MNSENYTVEELLQIMNLNIDDLDNSNTIKQTTNQYINEFSNDPEMSNFFKGAQKKLLALTTQPTQPTKTQQESWLENQYISPQKSLQKDKITDRTNKTQVFEEGEHNPVNQEQLGVTNTVTVPYAQDSLNPTLKNTIERSLVLDSKYREYSAGGTSTDYILYLSDPLINVLSIRLYSYQIPYTWYNIDSIYGNTTLWIRDSINQPIPIEITIQNGSYNTPSAFITEINNVFNDNGFTDDPVSYNQLTGKITITIKTAPFVITPNTEIIFYDITCKLSPKKVCVHSVTNNNYFDESLGWLMGYKDPILKVDSVLGNQAMSTLNLMGTKYLILSMDDYNQNHLNNGLVTISEPSKYINLPYYYSCDILSSAKTEIPNILQQQQISLNDEEGLLILDKMHKNGYKKNNQAIVTQPRVLTQAQIYTINEIIKNNRANTNYKTRAPTTTDVFSPIPIKVGSSPLGTLIVDFGGSLQDNKKTYFGPVNIERMRVKLMDDKGNPLNLNGADWSITLIVECLYQY